MSFIFCSSSELMAQLNSSALIALIDLREQEEFSHGHILRSSNAPLSHIEFLIEKLVPTRNTPVILVDSGKQGDNRSMAGSTILGNMGYKKIFILQNGLEDWRTMGNLIVSGTSCMAKGYAEYLEKSLHTPAITPHEICARMKNGEKIVLADIRDPEEFENMAIPGGISTPGCEVAYRFLDIVSDPETLVVTNCGSRTRGILCAQMLKDFGVKNPVASLRGGTLNWRLSGEKLEYGRVDRTPYPSFSAIEFARNQAKMMAKKYHISFIDATTLQTWMSEAPENPLYIFDVRQPEEYQSGHLYGSRCAPGCQLTQLSDDFFAIRNARIVLVDDTEARSIITAYWLKQVAVPNVYVLKGGIGGNAFLDNWRLESGPEKKRQIVCNFNKGISPHELQSKLQSQPPVIINVGSSSKHRTGHIPGAIWGSRCWLSNLKKADFENKPIVVASDNELHSRLAASDLQNLWPETEILFVEGGMELWRQLQLPLEKGMPASFCAENDIWYLAYKDPNARREIMEDFFDWSNTLGNLIEKDPTYKVTLPVARRLE